MPPTAVPIVPITNPCSMDAELVRLRPEEISVDTDPIADIEQLEDTKIELGHRVLANVHLRARPPIGQLQEARFAERPDGEDPAGGADVDSRLVELRGGFRAVLGDQTADRDRTVETLRVRIDPELIQRIEIGPALDDLI